MDDNSAVDVNEQVVLQKFEGEPVPENEYERLVVENGLVTQHYKIENGNVAGPVEDSLVGVEICRLVNMKEVD